MADIVATIDLVPGLILSEPIVNPFGQTLIEAGEEISYSQIKMLKTWGIGFVAIQTEEKDDSEEISEDKIKAGVERLTKRLTWKPRNKIEQDLIDMGIIASMEKLKMNKG
jgi:hypothetical protein